MISLFISAAKAPPKNWRWYCQASYVAGEPKEFSLLDSDHDYRFHPDLIEEMNRLLGDFIERYGL